MGDRIQKIAGIIFALAFIGILAAMNQQVIRFGQNTNRQVNQTATASVSYELEPFNGTIVSGDTVISAIKNRNTLTSANLSIKVENSYGNVEEYNDNGGLNRYDPSTGGIGPQDRYEASLNTNANGVVSEIFFKYTT